jgi:hypothetical protein
MNMMKKTAMAFFSLLFLISALTVQAQNRRQISDEDRAERFEKLAANLDLTEEQKTSFQQINEKYLEDMKEVRNSSLEREERWEKMKALSNEHDEAIQGVLNEEQYAKYKELRQERVRQRQGQREGNRGKGVKGKGKHKHKGGNGKNVDPEEENEDQ